MTVHLYKSKDRFRCGKRNWLRAEGSDDIGEVTCKTCIDSFRHDKGLASAYSLGQNGKKPNYITYKQGYFRLLKTNKKLEKELAKFKKENEKLIAHIKGDSCSQN